MNILQFLNFVSYKYKLPFDKLQKDLEDFAKTEAIGQQRQERVKELEENGEKPSQADVFGNLVDQMMAVLKKDNPTLEREQLASLPPAVINGIFKFILKEGMGLEKGHGKDMEAEKTVDTSA